jgi:hypothetical protein
MSSADFAEGRLRQRQSVFQRLYDLADFDAKPAPVREDEDTTLVNDILQPDEQRKRERFIPVTRFALLDRLTKPYLWPPGQAAEARRLEAEVGPVVVGAIDGGRREVERERTRRLERLLHEVERL